MKDQRIFLKVLYRTYHIELIYTFILGYFTFIFTLFAIVYQLMFVDMVSSALYKTKEVIEASASRMKYMIKYPDIYIKLYIYESPFSLCYAFS